MQKIRKSNLLTGLALATAGLFSGCASLTPRSNQYSHVVDFEFGIPSYVSAEDKKHSNTPKEAKSKILDLRSDLILPSKTRLFDDLQRPNFSSSTSISPFMFNLNKKSDFEQVVESVVAGYLAKVVRTLNHEVNGHGKVFSNVHGRSQKDDDYDIAFNFAWRATRKYTSFNLTTMKHDDLSGNLGFTAGSITTYADDLTPAEDDAVSLGGVWASQTLYDRLNSSLRNSNSASNSSDAKDKFSHWLAFFAGLDFPLYAIDAFTYDPETETAGGSDISQLLNHGYKTDIRRAFFADLIGKAPDLYWHASRALGFKTKRPEFFTFNIPYSNFILNLRPSAVIDPYNHAIGPGFRLEIYTGDKK